MNEAPGQDTITLKLRTASEFFDALSAPDLAVRVATFEAVMAAPDKALAFGRHHGKDIVDALTELAHTAGEFTTRRMAVTALARFDDPRAVEALKKQYCFTDDPETLALIAHRLTHEPAKVTTEFLAPFLNDGPRSPRARIAADVLADRPDLPVETRVRAALLTGRPDVDPPTLDSESAVAWRLALASPLAARARDALRGQGLDAFILVRAWWDELDNDHRTWLVEWGLERFAPYAAELVMRALESGRTALQLASMRGIWRMGPGGLNAGRSSFAPGDPVHILVYKSPNVSITNVEASAGAIHPGPAQNIEITDILTFSNSREASLSKPVSGALSIQWYGTSLGELSVGDDGVSVRASQSGVGVAKVTYQTVARSYRLSSPLNVNGEKNFQILVLVIGSDGNNG